MASRRQPSPRQEPHVTVIRLSQSARNARAAHRSERGWRPVLAILVLVLGLAPVLALAQSRQGMPEPGARMIAAVRGARSITDRIRRQGNGDRERLQADAVAAEGLLDAGGPYLRDLDPALYEQAQAAASDLVIAAEQGAPKAAIEQRTTALGERLGALQDAVDRWQEDGIAVRIGDLTLAPGSAASVPLVLSRGSRSGITAFNVEIAYDPAVLSVRDVQAAYGSLLVRRDAGRLTVQGSLARVMDPGQRGPTLVTITFDVTGHDGDGTALTIARVSAGEASGGRILAIGDDGAVWVQAPVDLPPQTLGPGFLATKTVVVVAVGAGLLYIVLRVLEHVARKRGIAAPPAPAAPTAAPTGAEGSGSPEAGAAPVARPPPGPSDAVPPSVEASGPSPVVGEGAETRQEPAPAPPVEGAGPQAPQPHAEEGIPQADSQGDVGRGVPPGRW